MKIRRLAAEYIWNMLYATDQWLNALFAGDPNETISSRLGKSHRGDHGKTIYWITYLPWVFTNIIFYPFSGWGHCESNIETVEQVGTRDLLNTN